MARSGTWSLAAGAFVVLLAGSASATPAAVPIEGPPDRIAPMTITVVRDTQPGCAPACAAWIAAQGKIVPGTRAVFARVLQALGKRRLPVFVDSGGGSVVDAMAMGREIRARHLDVVVTRTVFDAGPKDRRGAADGSRPGRAHGIGALCASACTLLLAAGDKREVAPWTFVGIHQIIMNETLTRVERFYRTVSRQVNGEKVVLSRTLIGERPLSTVHFTATPSRATYQSVSTYLAGMGIGAGLMPLMLATPPSGVHWMTPDEQQVTNLVTDRVDGEYLAGEAERAPDAGSPAERSLPEQAFFVQAGSDPAKPHVAVGRVRWTLEQAAPEAPAPRPVALRADVDIPDAGLSLQLRMTRKEATGPAVLVMDLAFVTAVAGAVHSVERVGMPQARMIGGPVPITMQGTVEPNGTDRFRVVLSGPDGLDPAHQVILESRPWLDLPLLIDGAAPAKLTFEHGPSGTPLLSEALRAWTAAGPPQASTPAAPKG